MLKQCYVVFGIPTNVTQKQLAKMSPLLWGVGGVWLGESRWWWGGYTLPTNWKSAFTLVYLLWHINKSLHSIINIIYKISSSKYLSIKWEISYSIKLLNIKIKRNFILPGARKPGGTVQATSLPIIIDLKAMKIAALFWTWLKLAMWINSRKLDCLQM